MGWVSGYCSGCIHITKYYNPLRNDNTLESHDMRRWHCSGNAKPSKECMLRPSQRFYYIGNAKSVCYHSVEGNYIGNATPHKGNKKSSKDCLLRPSGRFHHIRNFTTQWKVPLHWKCEECTTQWKATTLEMQLHINSKCDLWPETPPASHPSPIQRHSSHSTRVILDSKPDICHNVVSKGDTVF